jgi:anti-anti-sigma factor
MQITTSVAQSKPSVTIVAVQGDINAQTSDQFEAAARHAIESGARNLLLDFAQVPYVSTAGLRSIQDIFNLLHTADTETENGVMREGLRDGRFKSAHLKLLNPSPEVARVLKITGFDMFIESYRDLPAALAAF